MYNKFLINNNYVLIRQIGEQSFTSRMDDATANTEKTCEMISPSIGHFSVLELACMSNFKNEIGRLQKKLTLKEFEIEKLKKINKSLKDQNANLIEEVKSEKQKLIDFYDKFHIQNDDRLNLNEENVNIVETRDIAKRDKKNRIDPSYENINLEIEKNAKLQNILDTMLKIQDLKSLITKTLEFS